MVVVLLAVVSAVVVVMGLSVGVRGGVEEWKNVVDNPEAKDSFNPASVEGAVVVVGLLEGVLMVVRVVVVWVVVGVPAMYSPALSAFRTRTIFALLQGVVAVVFMVMVAVLVVFVSVVVVLVEMEVVVLVLVCVEGAEGWEKRNRCR